MPRRFERCIECRRGVTARQQKLPCGVCGEMQHRLCGTLKDIVSQEMYRKITSGEFFFWSCKRCTHPSPTYFEAMGEESSEDEQPAIPFVYDTPMIHSSPPASSSPPGTPTRSPLAAQRLSLSPVVSQPRTPSNDVPVPMEDDPLETSLTTPLPQIMLEADDTTFEVIAHGSQKAKLKLIENTGFSYVKHSQRGNKIYWRCSVRNKKQTCKAFVVESSEHFTKGSHAHCHPPKAGLTIEVKVRAQSKKVAKEQLFSSASEIVDRAIASSLSIEETAVLPNKANVIRATNRVRESGRPKHPDSLAFTIVEEHIPLNFLRGDITVDGRRHLIFATDEQLRYLSQGKKWYMDGTFRVVRKPFFQLFSVHVFVRKDNVVKQVPGMFALMSGKRKKDYRRVLSTLISALPSDPAVRTVVMDFEQATWEAVRLVLPDVVRRGCAFHWAQAVDRKVKELGLSVAYRQDQGTRCLVRKYLALQFLPAQHIEATFQQISKDATTPALQQLSTYIEDQWVDSSIFTPVRWSVYGKSVRTNNDVEGWHTRFNRHCKNGALNMYLLIHLLHQEALTVPIQARMVLEKTLQRYQRKKYATIQGSLFNAWKLYEDGEFSVIQLLEKVSMIYVSV